MVKKNLLILIFAPIILGVFLYAEYIGLFWHNNIFANKYSTHGLDVSHHQGKIDWPTVGTQKKYSFVYIKGTEGHDFIDPRFEENWQGAKSVGLKVGAYHFFSMRSSGDEQARYYMQTVPNESGTLAPALDVEVSARLDPAVVRVEIDNWIKEIEKHYGRKPVIYATSHTYNAYIRGHFGQYQIWIRDILKPAYLPDRQWAIWQYSNRGRVPGIGTLADQNVLYGDLSELTN